MRLITKRTKRRVHDFYVCYSATMKAIRASGRRLLLLYTIMKLRYDYDERLFGHFFSYIALDM